MHTKAMAPEVVPNDVPHESERTKRGRGEWLLDTWVSHIPMTLELMVADPFSQGPPEGRRSPDGGMVDVYPPMLIRRYQFQPGVPVDVPRVHRTAIHHAQCHHVDCLQRPFACQDPEHVEWQQIVGGLGPQLRLVGQKTPPKLHPSISDEPEAVPVPHMIDALNPKPVKSPEQLALDRARARRASGGAK